ncbi:MAG: RidA family protein [bacterium]
MPREHLHGTPRQEARAFSPAVITRGGRQVWLSGVGECVDEDGNSMAGDFEAQTRATFRTIEKVLERAGGGMKDIVTMTVFISESRHGDRFTEIRKEIFPAQYPASALISVSGFTRPEKLIEIQAVAVIGDE